MIKFSANEMNNLTETERKAIDKLRKRVSESFRLRQLVLFGSKASGELLRYSKASDVMLKKAEQKFALAELSFEKGL